MNNYSILNSDAAQKSEILYSLLFQDWDDVNLNSLTYNLLYDDRLADDLKEMTILRLYQELDRTGCICILSSVLTHLDKKRLLFDKYVGELSLERLCQMTDDEMVELLKPTSVLSQEEQSKINELNTPQMAQLFLDEFSTEDLENALFALHTPKERRFNKFHEIINIDESLNDTDYRQLLVETVYNSTGHLQSAMRYRELYGYHGLVYAYKTNPHPHVEPLPPNSIMEIITEVQKPYYDLIKA